MLEIKPDPKYEDTTGTGTIPQGDLDELVKAVAQEALNDAPKQTVPSVPPSKN